MDQGDHSSEQVGDEYQREEQTPPRSNTPTAGSYGDEVDIKLWTVKVRRISPFPFMLACWLMWVSDACTSALDCII